MKFAIDIGHNCSPDIGAKGIKFEDALTKEVGSKVIEKLKKLGHEVINVLPVRCNSVSDSLNRRVQVSNLNNVNLYVSIHFNAGGGQGSEVYFYPGSTTGERYSKSVLSELVKLGYKNRGVKNGSSLYVVRNAKAPAILIEVSFVDSKDDMSKYNAEKIANAIVKGLTGKAPEESVPVKDNDKENKIYKVQVGAFTDKNNAEAMVQKLKEKGFNAVID
ncbi:N-acetylmuramoyl-L-alanine amidase [Clostridium peptidivorans]|uniref:N-acetylmuramoyl-L-alanine amidase n=1 Tax=Clostridium peptidivorans TaxID=100174 RepID=UPI000BE2E525|nr:N-acetylmuramoyl-L-alanine amidase [Clostridium peptidivorans]